MREEFTIYRGQTFQGQINLKNQDGSTYSIPSGSLIEAIFPPDPAQAPGVTSVILSTANSGEITVTGDGDSGQISYSGAPAKSLELNPILNAAVDVRVTEPSTQVRIFEKAHFVNIKDKANPG